MLLSLAALAQRGALAQPPGRVVRVGFITAQPARTDAVVRMYEQAMGPRGYAEGRNLLTEWRTLEGQFERMTEIVAELMKRKSDVIVVGHISMAQLVTKTTSTIPIFSLAGDPQLRGVVHNLNRPGGNINGIFAAGSITVEQKRLDLLRELAPKMRRVAFVFSREWWDGSSGQALREAAAKIDLQVVHVESNASGFDDAFAAIKREKPDAMFFEASPAAFGSRASIGEFAAASGIPSACGHQELVEAGCLMTYNFTTAETFRVLADFIDRIAKGAKVGELPFQQYTRYELAVNAKTAKAIGLTIPQSVLMQAGRVIE